jgi:glycosyltransferase involved in cell wall biosynthesis
MPASRTVVDGSRHTGRLRVLVVTRCFPNRVEPLACAFARQQLACLGRLADVEVIAPVPYLPGASLLGERTRPGRLAAVPRHEHIDGLPVAHPRAPYLPGASLLPGLPALNAPLYAAALLRHFGAVEGRFDVVLGTFLYPDGVGAAALARLLGLPLVLKAHGTDVNVVGRWPSVRPMIRAALRHARASLAVSRPMIEALVRLGAPCDRTSLLPNGVDRDLFRPRDRITARCTLDLPTQGRMVLFVGDLEPQKGVGELHDAWTALRRKPGAPVHLVLVGDGSMTAKLAHASRTLADPERGRLILAGRRPLTDVAEHLGACDLLALPSWHEGTPNVVLEALASARPVVGSRVGGIPDAVPEGRAGLLVHPRDPRELEAALAAALGRAWDEQAVLSAAPPSWEESAAKLHEVLMRAAGREPTARAANRTEGSRMIN